MTTKTMAMAIAASLSFYCCAGVETSGEPRETATMIDNDQIVRNFCNIPMPALRGREQIYASLKVLRAHFGNCAWRRCTRSRKRTSS